MTLIQHMTYHPVDGTASSVELMSFARLRELNDGGTQRADFHVVAVIDAGAGAVTVDFRTYPLRPRSAVWIAPGAVHRWDGIVSITGELVLFTPAALVTDATRQVATLPDPLPQWDLPVADWRYVDLARSHLRVELSAVPGGVVPDLPELLLTAFVARLAPPSGPGPAMSPAFRAFRSSVEAHYRRHHDVGFYAHVLGYAPRTLSRATQQATGHTAKGYLTERIVLEAKRLLAHDRLTAAGCARTLGLTDASNFSEFFRHATGQRPGAWQAAAVGRDGAT